MAEEAADPTKPGERALTPERLRVVHSTIAACTDELSRWEKIVQKRWWAVKAGFGEIGVDMAPFAVGVDGLGGILLDPSGGGLLVGLPQGQLPFSTILKSVHFTPERILAVHKNVTDFIDGEERRLKELVGKFENRDAFMAPFQEDLAQAKLDEKKAEFVGKRAAGGRPV